jgi:hypothetical protein
VNNSMAGVSSWVVDGTSQLYNQWFYYRVGTSTSGQGGELPISALPLFSSEVNSAGDVLTLVYGDQRSFTIQVRYSLQGGGAGSLVSDLGEQINIRNWTDHTLDFHFFQYSDFDLAGTPQNDNTTLVNANTIRQTDTTTQATLSETVVTPAPSHYQIANFASLFLALNDGGPTTLNDSSAGAVQPGDMEWAFQWDFSIGAGDTVNISKDKRLDNYRLPDSGTTAGLLGMAMTALAMIRRRVSR